MPSVLRVDKARFVAPGTGNKSNFKYFKSSRMFAFHSYGIFSEKPCHTHHIWLRPMLVEQMPHASEFLVA